MQSLGTSDIEESELVLVLSRSMSFFVSAGELAAAAPLEGAPLPLTKQKSLRCYGENIKKDDGKNYEIEKIRKDEDVIETLQQRHSRDTNCVVVTSVSDIDPLSDAKIKDYSRGGADAAGDIDLSLSHGVGSQFGVGGDSADISLGQDFDAPQLDAGFGTLHDPPRLDIPSIPSVGSDFDQIHVPPKLHIPGRSPPFGGGAAKSGVPKSSLDSGFGSLQDINTYRTGSTSDTSAAGGAPIEEENVKTYEFATNVKRQESYDHRGFHQERSRVAAPGGAWRTTFRHDGPGGAGSTYETSANDLDHKISAVSGARPAAARALHLALLLLLPRALLRLLR